jgi:hypothetical protein
MLRKIFGPERGEVCEQFMVLHDEKLHNLCSSPSVIRVVKSRRLQWSGHVARIAGDKVCTQNFDGENLVG